MKKLTSIFLLFIICIQYLPVKELGDYIFEQSFIEDDFCRSVEKKETKQNANAKNSDAETVC